MFARVYEDRELALWERCSICLSDNCTLICMWAPGCALLYLRLQDDDLFRLALELIVTDVRNCVCALNWRVIDLCALNGLCA